MLTLNLLSTFLLNSHLNLQRAVYGGSAFNFIHFVVGLILVVCALAILIILVKWLCSLAGVAIPQPLLLVLGILLFVILFIVLLNWAGLGIW
jgi:hypothetical protein